MTNTEAKTTMYQDLLAAQKEIEGVTKDGKNPFFKSDYTTLNATILACKEILNKYNFIVLQPLDSDEHGVYVCTTLIHTSGDAIKSKMAIRESKDKDPQAQGSAITYARRYSLKSLLMMSDADDDGERAQNTYRQKDKEEFDVADTAICPVHNAKMTEKVKDDGTTFFWHRLEDGAFCNGRKTKYNKEK